MNQTPHPECYCELVASLIAVNATAERSGTAAVDCCGEMQSRHSEHQSFAMTLSRFGPSVQPLQAVKCQSASIIGCPVSESYGTASIVWKRIVADQNFVGAWCAFALRAHTSMKRLLRTSWR
jgi:hypothetical protein